MKIVDGFTLRSVAGEKIVSGEGVAQINFNKLISLNESAAYLWQAVEGGEFSIEKLTDLLLEEYDIEREKAFVDASAIANKWLELGLIEE